jgi:hypothetical protein
MLTSKKGAHLLGFFFHLWISTYQLFEPWQPINGYRGKVRLITKQFARAVIDAMVI